MHIHWSKPGLISPNGCWVCFHKYYMYTGDTLWELAKDMYRFWNSEHAIIG